MRFYIHTYYDAIEDRIPVNYQVRVYVEERVTEAVLSSYNAILESSWNYAIYVHFTSDEIHKSIDIIPMTEVKGENVRMSTVIIPVSIIRGENDQVLFYTKTLIQTSECFFKSIFKKRVNVSFDDSIQIDLEYIHSFKYPADFDDQRYTGDETLKSLRGN